MLRFHPPGAPGPHGAVYAAVLVDPRAVMLFGAAPRQLPAAGEVTFSAAGAGSGIWRAVGWPQPGGDAVGFLAVLGVDSVTQLHSGTVRVRRADGGADAVLPPIGRVDPDPAVLVEALRAEGVPSAPVLDFLHGIVGAPGLETAGGLRDFHMAALTALSRQSGVVEIIGRAGSGGLLVQGWSCDLDAGRRRLLLQHAGIEACDGLVASFARDDLDQAGHGTVAFIEDAGADAAPELRRIHFAAGDDYRYLEVVEEPVRLSPQDAVPHLERMMATLTGDEDVRRAFRRLCRPRFGGVDTTASLAAPVRLSVDRALHVPGAGFFLAGWMLDPTDSVTLVLFRSTENVYRRIHDSWHRTRRPDVVAGYAEDDLFRAQARRLSEQCGFMVFVPHDEPAAQDERFYLEIVLRDETRGFLPVAFETRPADAVVADILGEIDVDDHAFETLVETHLGPLVGGAFAARTHPERPSLVTPFGARVALPDISIILPVIGQAEDIDINLSRFSGDADFDSAELILVAAQSTLPVAPARIREWAEFYGFNGRLVLAAQDMDRFDALEFGTGQASSDLLLFISETVLPEEPGWLGALVGALKARPDAAAISPTLLYEDFSIRYAGLPVEEAPRLERNGLRQLTGYPASWLAGRTLSQVHGVSEDCVVIRRAAFERIGGFARDFAGPEFKGVDFSLRLGAAGFPLLWLPSVALFALDDPPSGAAPPYWKRPAQKIDAWRLAQIWMPAAGGPPHPTRFSDD